MQVIGAYGVVIGLSFCIVFGLVFISNLFDRFDVIGALLAIVSASCSALLFYFLFFQSNTGLRSNEQLINKRLQEIKQKEQNIQKLTQDLNEQGDPQRNRRRFQALDKGLAELPHQRNRYFEKLREIELIRWSNQLSPLLSHSPNLTEQQTTERLEMLDKIRTQGQQLAQIWEEDPLADEETRCADRLNQALTTCDQLRQDLLDLKTALAVGDISAFNKEEQRASQTALELLDTFNALPDVGGFTAGFKKLEDEYFRLQSEDEVRQLTK